MQSLFLSLLFILFPLPSLPSHATSAPPAVGDKAPDFTLTTLDGKRVKLSEVTANSPVVLVALRGFPGYQCPLCNIQVHDYLKNAEGFANAGAKVILVYPGPPENLDGRAKEFVADKPMPAGFTFLLDPDYVFTNLYGLRWDAPKETAYPSTFLIDRQGVVFFAKVSKTHGGRTKANEVLEILMKKKTN